MSKIPFLLVFPDDNTSILTTCLLISYDRFATFIFPSFAIINFSIIYNRLRLRCKWLSDPRVASSIISYKNIFLL